MPIVLCPVLSERYIADRLDERDTVILEIFLQRTVHSVTTGPVRSVVVVVVVVSVMPRII